MGSPEKTNELLLELSNIPNLGNRSDMIARAMRTAIALVDADAAVLALVTPRKRGERLVLHAGSPTPAALPLANDGSAILRALGDRREPIAYPDLLDIPELSGVDGCPGVDAGPVLFTPLYQRDPLPGYLGVYRKRGRARYTLAETQAMLLLAAWLSAAVENLRISAGSDRVAITDGKTETYNRRFLEKSLRQELRRANRFGQELSVVKIEVDQLAALRESGGAARANALLASLASLLGQQVRSFDVLGRGKGESFLVVLPQTGKDGAAEVAERMRLAVAGFAFEPEAAGAVTTTFGLATFPHDGLDLDALLAVAERALAQGRLHGSNRVASTDRRAA